MSIHIDARSFYVIDGEDTPRCAFDNAHFGDNVTYCPFCGKKIGVYY
jgi:hypothetical protein